MKIRQGERVGEPGGGSPHRVRRLPRRGLQALAPLGILILIAVGFVRYCFVYIAPNEVGIKEVRIGWNRGIQPDVYGAGYAFCMPFGFQNIHTYPRNVQALELTGFGDASEETDTHHYADPVKIQTSDGYFVDVDVTVLYRIEDPYRVITSLGPGRRYLEMGVIPRTEPNLKQAYGELTTEDFYNSPLRVKQGELALTLMNNDLNEKGIVVDQVLVRYFAYSDEIQKNIEDKKLKDQLVFTNQSKNKAAQAEAELKRVTQEGEMKVLITSQQGEAYKMQKDAARDLYTRTKRAEADLLVQLAEAARTEFRNEAMQVVGSDKAVAMKMAEAMQGLDVVIVPTGGPAGVNPLDLNRMVEMFGSGNSSEALPATSAVTAPIPTPPPPPVSLREAPVPTTTEVPPDAAR